MKQVLIIHGGESFSTHTAYLAKLQLLPISYERLKYHQSWKTWIATQLPDDDVLLPSFPNSHNASYDEWKLYFEKLLPFFGKDVRIVGHSLGAMFLAKYLHEHQLPASIAQLVLIAGQYGEPADDDVGSFRVSSATGAEQSAKEIHLFHSEDDPVVEFSSLRKFAHDLPNAIVHTFKDRAHFNDETFPELLELLKK